MKLALISCLLAALYSSSLVLAEAIQDPAASPTIDYISDVTPTTELVREEDAPNLE